MAESLNFIRDYVRLCEETEAPPVFAVWCGIAAISAALGRNSWLQFGQFPIFPNFFIIIVASSGHYRKSTSIEISASIIRSLQPTPKLISQKVTPEALIKAVRHVETNDMQCLLKESGTAYVIADEFNVFLNKKSYEAGLAPLLIQLFDCKDKISYDTISRGVEEVNNSCLGILGGSTMDWLKSGIPEEAVGGGLTSRMLFVYYDGPVRDVAWPEFGEKHQAMRQKLTEHLQQISKISGEFFLSPEARDMYNKEYSFFRHNTISTGGGKEFFFDSNLRGYASRRHIHLLKLSMIFSASEGFTREISAENLGRARVSLQTIESNLPKIISQITATDSGTSLEWVLRLIKQKGVMTMTELQRAAANRYNARELNEILYTLEAAGLVSKLFDGRSQSIKYLGDLL